MCYKAFTKKAKTKQVAEKDIKVYKICTNTDHIVVSYFRKYIYVPLEITHKINVTFVEEFGLNYIVDGYHSYKSCKWYPYLSKYKELAVIVEDTYKIYDYKSPVVIAEFIIPKGTIYYENTNGEIVSNQIMFTGIIHKPIIHDGGRVESVKMDLNEENRTVSAETIR